MGNKNPSKQPQIFEHPRLGSVSLVNAPNKLLQHTFSVSSTSQGEAFKQQLQKLSKIDTSHLFLPESVSIERAGLCGSSGFVKAQYPVYEYSLEKEILERVASGMEFKEREVIFLLSVLAHAGKAFEPDAAKIGDIRPKNILMNQEGDIKIFCAASAPDENTGIFKAYQNKEKAYLSPQELKELANSNPTPSTINNPKSQVFSAGVTVLQCGTKGDAAGMILPNGLENLKSGFSNAFTPVLAYIVSKMVELDPVKRPYFSEIAALLEPSRDDILEKRDIVLQPKDCNEALRRYYQTGNKLNSHAFENMLTELGQQPQSQTVIKANFQPMNYQPASYSIPTTNPAPLNTTQRRTLLLQDIVPASHITESIYQPTIYNGTGQPYNGTTTQQSQVIRGTGLPQIKFNYQSRQ